jgi:hypothetical protein
MNDPMFLLEWDHRDACKLLTSLTQSDEGFEREMMAAQLRELLTFHFQIEELLVHPLVARCVGAEDEEEAVVEHHLASEGLAEMIALVDMPGFGAVTAALLAGFAHHVEEEEAEILPALSHALTRRQWLDLGDAIARAKRAAGRPAIPLAPRRRSDKRAALARD